MGKSKSGQVHMGVPILSIFGQKVKSVENCSIRFLRSQQLTKDRLRLMADVFTRWYLNQLRHFFCLSALSKTMLATNGF